MSPRTKRILPTLGTTLVAAALAVASGTAALAAPSAHRAGPASKVPVSQVGLGWSIAEISTAPVPNGHATKGKTTLYAVSPQGHKYAFYSWPVSKSSASSYYLVDWSGDGQRVLLANLYKYEQISLVTGKVINSFKLPPSETVFSYTRPDGENVLTTGPGGVGVRRYNLDGQLQQVLATKGFTAIDSPDGTTVIDEASYGLEVLGNTGGVVRQLHAPIAVDGCNPARWWNSTTVLAYCNAKHGSGAARLWLFPVNGGKVTALTAQRGGSGPDLGDIDAWKLTSGVYLQALGPCGVEFVAQQSANGSAHEVKLPGVNYPSFHIVTGQGSSLLVQPENGCNAGASLVWFNPHTKKVSWIFRTPSKIVGVEATVPYGRPIS
jgi:hypothetical protein